MLASESRVSFQLSILKILDGRASLEVIKQHLAILYTSGHEWTERMKRLAERAPGLDIFVQKLVAREPGVWSITEDGRSFLAMLERPAAADHGTAPVEPSLAVPVTGASARPAT